MANLGNTIINGILRVNGKVYTSSGFVGDLTGLASKATADASGNVITSTYSTKANTIRNLAISGRTITYTKDDGSTGTLTTQDTTYSAATTSANGLMSASDKTKLDSVESGANNYVLPEATSSTLGGVKTGSNITNTDGTISLTKGNVTSALGYTPPIQDTTYDDATESTHGLMTAADKTKVNKAVISDDLSVTNTISLTRETYNTLKEAGTLSSNTLYNIIDDEINLDDVIASDIAEDVNSITISNNKLTYTKNSGTSTSLNLPTASDVTTTTNGLMLATDKVKLDGIEAGAQVNTITGVKGSSESTYRTGNVSISASNIGLGNVENKSSATIRSEITSSNVTTALGYTPADSSNLGKANGIATLDSEGKVPSSQLPSYVDDVIEYDTKDSFPTTGETGKIYIAKDTNLTYRWGGSSYVMISSALALGETSSTAYRGDRGAAAYAHAVTNKGSAFSSGLYKITTNSEGHVTAATAVAKTDITALGIPAQDTTYSVATTSANGLMSSTDKTKLNGIEEGAQVNTVTGVKGDNESSYRTGNINITKANIGLGNVDNTSDANKPISTATQTALDNKLTKTGDTATGAMVFNSTLTMSDVNNATYTTSTTANISPSSVALSNPPWVHDFWHDHFAFMRNHSIDSQETTTDGSTWTTATKTLNSLFMEKDATTLTILTSSELAYRFVLKNANYAYSGVSWFEMGVAYTSPFSNFKIKIEFSSDKSTWSTCHESSITGNSQPFFLRNTTSFTADGYLRFTFTKTSNTTSGTVNLTCLKAFCTRKGNQGLGIEYEYPYDWDASANLLPIADNTKNLGSSSKRWNTIYATTLSGNATSASTATKATQDSDGNQINTTYLKLSGGAMSGNISYKGTQSTTEMIKFVDNTSDAYGNGIAIGGGGLTVIGSGESTAAIISGQSGGTEAMIIGGDQTIQFYTNCQDGISSAKSIVMEKDGTITAAGFNGTATKATQDGNGNIISSTYLPLSGGTMTGAITLKGLNVQSLEGVTTDFNSIVDGIYHTYTDGNTSNYISNAPVQTSQVLMSFTPYSSGDDIRTAQLDITGYGELYVRGFRNTDKPWFKVLTSNNFASYALGKDATAVKATSDADGNVISSTYAKKSSLATVATSGSYNDLSNKPTINDKTLTIQKNGTNVATFTANSSSDVTANIVVPTKTSELTNDSGYKTTDTNTTYTLTQDTSDGHKITLTPSTGTATTITIPDNNTTYSDATTSTHGLMSTSDKSKLDGIASGAEVNVQANWNTTDTSADSYIQNKPTKVSAFTNDSGYTTNIGTITGITMNGSSKGTSGVIDLGTVITDISGKQDKGNYISYTTSTATVAGNSKNVSKTSPETLFVPNGLIMGGTAQAAGLVTRGICGVATPDSSTGACTKENLYINYDGDNNFNASRQIVLNASSIGNHLGNNMYQYAVPRGDIVKAWVEAKGYTTNTGTITGITMNGSSKGTSGVVDLGTVITDVSGKQDKLTAGDNIVINGTTISATSTTYTAGANIQINGSTISATDTTYDDATTSAHGLMTAADKTKLDNAVISDDLSVTNTISLTRTEYDSRKTAGTLVSNTLYNIIDDEINLDDVIASDIAEDINTITISGSTLKYTKNSGTSTSLNLPTYSEATTTTAGLLSASDKVKLNGIATGAEVNVQSDWNVTDTSSDAYILNKPTKVSDFTNDAGYIISSSSITGNATTASRPSGFTSNGTSWTWGTLTTANSYSQITKWAYDGGEIAFAGKSNQLSVQIDGFFYQNEGKNLVLDSGNYTNYTTSKANTIKSLSISGKTITYTKGDDTTGTLTTQDTVYTHPTSGVTAGTYKSVTVDTNGHVTAGTNPTTLSGYGITDALSSSLKGAANGLAELDSDGKVPSTQLPSFVDDVLEYSSKSAFPTTGETGKIYVATDTNLTYRWSGSTYVEISASLALGTTSSTAYRGDYGNTAYTHATDANRLTTATASGLYKIAATANGHVQSLTAVTKSDITGLGIPSSDTNTTYTIATGDSNGQIKVTPSSGDAYNVSVKGLGSNAYTSTAYLPLAGGTMTGELCFSSGVALHWNDATYRQRINVTDDSTSGTAVFTFQQSEDAGSSYKDLMTIKDDGSVVATTFVGALSGNATSATKATQDGDGNTITSKYVTIDTAQTVSGAKTFSGITTVSNTTASSSTTTGALVVSGGLGVAGSEYLGGSLYIPSGDILLTKNATSGGQQIKWSTAANDYARIYGAATASNAGYLEIATADDSNEPIYVRQYSGAFSTVTRTLTLLDSSGNTTAPGTIKTVAGKVNFNDKVNLEYDSTYEGLKVVFA